MKVAEMKNGVLTYRNLTPEEEEEWEKAQQETHPQEPTLDDRVKILESTKANQTEVDELNEALNMILTGVTE